MDDTNETRTVSVTDLLALADAQDELMTEHNSL